ncbi:hypothetical protein AAC387_Pa02g5119 [Persea americana]
MADSVDSILDFLKLNGFTEAEAALRGELSNRSESNGAISSYVMEGGEDSVIRVKDQSKGSRGSQSGEISKELIVKEVEGGTVTNGSITKLKSVSVGERSKGGEILGSGEKSAGFARGSENALGDLYSWNINPGNGNVDPFLKDDIAFANSFSGLQISEQLKCCSGPVLDRKNSTGVVVSGENYKSESDSMGSMSRSQVDVMHERNQTRDHIVFDQARKPTNACSKGKLLDNPWSTSVGPMQSSLDPWKECSVKTILPFPMANSSSNYDNIFGSGNGVKEGKQKLGSNDMWAAKKEHIIEMDQLFELGKSQGCSNPKDIGSISSHSQIVPESQKEELPQLPPVKLKLEDKSISIHWDEKVDHHVSGTKITMEDETFFIGSYLDIPIGQEISSSGGKRTVGSSWLSVSQGIAEDASDLVSGFATIGDGLSESIDYPNEYWDSDEYDDDEDVGYMRQPIEDEAWFLAHEIDYPSDNEKGTGHGSVPEQQERGPIKDEGDDQSFLQGDSYLSGEQYIRSKNIEQVAASEDPTGLSMSAMNKRTNENDSIVRYDGQLMDEELNLIRSEPVWQGFVTQANDLIMFGNGTVINESERPRHDDLCIGDKRHGSVRSIGVGISSDVVDVGSERRESLVEGSSEGDLEYVHDNDARIRRPGHLQHAPNKSYLERSNRDDTRAAKLMENKYVVGPANGALGTNYCNGNFSFPPPWSSGDGMQADSSKASWLSKGNAVAHDETDACVNGLMENDDILAALRQKSSDSSPEKSSQDENIADTERSMNSASSMPSNYGYTERKCVQKGHDDKASDEREEDPATAQEDEEAAAVQEQVRQIRAQEEEFETFDLRIVHRKNRTGFEEDKNFNVVLNSVIAGRYHVTEYLGSAAFSKAIQAHDLHTGLDVCVKIIKNNKDFFDQSLDEIKLLKFVNKNDPSDKYHILRLYDYFYYREHLLIVCELLKANLYEFHKFNRESGGEVYFTMPRLQSITIQCLESLQFLHGLGLIHCDLKPENILVKSYSRCEVKVIDLGSSCFQTDHLCSYVQSRSYRAPEVILGLPYDKKIDIWSLGCILAELCTGNVLFQNDSPATLLARVIGIIGPIDQSMLAKGRDTYKIFTKNHMLYERNQDTSRLEYLIPKKTSLRHRLPMGDQGFIDFVAHLLEVNPKKRPTASQALGHPWLSYPYEPISS